jgi:5'-methylthioinosine phosphorylase
MLGIIAGSGLTKLSDLTQVRREIVRTPFGDTSCAITFGVWHGADIAFINRHGYGHTLAPHQINYRANLWALQHVGVQAVCACSSVGSLSEAITPGQLVLPHDVLDYTQGRECTYFSGSSNEIAYTDMSQLFDERIRQQLQAACQSIQQTDDAPTLTQAVYACTNGPRLETCAEVLSMRQNGAQVVGMTLAPEGFLAKELGLPYAALSICTNYAAGVSGQAIGDIAQWQQLREKTWGKAQRAMAIWVTQ